jgi:maltose/maltodextrin transport system substrate-binding protein
MSSALKPTTLAFSFMKIKPGLLLWLISISIFGQNQPSIQDYCLQGKTESLVPIRPGIPGKQAFWNEKAMMFKYAPSFQFDNSNWIIPNPKQFRYSAFSFANNTYYTFIASSPFESLSPVWDKIPNGEVYLKVEALSDDGLDFTIAGSRIFIKAATFCPPYPEAKYSYKEAFDKGLKFMYNQKHIQNWYFSGTPDHQEYNLYCYSSKLVGSVIDAMLLYNSYFPENDTAIVIACNAADYLISKAEPAGSPLEYFPQVYEGQNLAARSFGEEIIIAQAAQTGKSFLALYDKTNEIKYLKSAINIADAYLKTQLPSGTWYIRMYKKNGKPVTEELCIPIEIAGFLSLLVNKYEQPQYQKVIDSSLKWVWDNPMKTFNWTGQFEDVAAYKSYNNLTKYEASWFAQYLLKNKAIDTSYVRLAKELIAFCEDQFVVWENPGMYDNFKNSTSRWQAPSVLEQYMCYVPIDASASQMIETFYCAYKNTSEKIYREKAIALTNSLINSQKADGMIPTFWVPGFLEFWNNCMFKSLQTIEMMIYSD